MRPSKDFHSLFMIFLRWVDPGRKGGRFSDGKTAYRILEGMRRRRLGGCRTKKILLARFFEEDIIVPTT